MNNNVAVVKPCCIIFSWKTWRLILCIARVVKNLDTKHRCHGISMASFSWTRCAVSNITPSAWRNRIFGSLIRSNMASGTVACSWCLLMHIPCYWLSLWERRLVIVIPHRKAALFFHNSCKRCFVIALACCMLLWLCPQAAGATAPPWPTPASGSSRSRWCCSSSSRSPRCSVWPSTWTQTASSPWSRPTRYTTHQHLTSKQNSPSYLYANTKLSISPTDIALVTLSRFPAR